MSIASRLRANAATSGAAAKVLALKDHDPGFLASLEQDNALLSEAADALDKALNRVTRLESALDAIEAEPEDPLKVQAVARAALDTEQP